MSVNMVAPLEVGICVKNMKKMVSFYTEVLDFDFINLAEAARDKSLASGFTPSGYEIIRLQTKYGERIKLNRPIEDPDEQQDSSYILERKGTFYLTFIVNDLSQIFERLKTTGTTVFPETGAIEVRPGVHLFTSKDPEGNYLEFVEYKDVCLYRNDLFNK